MDDSHPDSTTVPSVDNVSAAPPAPKADTPRPPPRPTLFQKLRFVLLRRIRNAAQSTDRNLLRLSALLSTPGGIDIVLCTTGYTLTLVYALGQQVPGGVVVDRFKVGASPQHVIPAWDLRTLWVANNAERQNTGSQVMRPQDAITVKQWLPYGLDR